MFNHIPVFGWLISLFLNVSLAIPFWFIWTHCHIGQHFFYFLPQVFQSIGFWDCVGLFFVIGILKTVLFPCHCHHCKKHSDLK